MSHHWSRDQCGHVTMKGQGGDPDMFGAKRAARGGAAW